MSMSAAAIQKKLEQRGTQAPPQWIELWEKRLAEAKAREAAKDE